MAVQARTFGFWSLSAARIVYVIEDAAPVKRFGFAYGTLPNHVECGEGDSRSNSVKTALFSIDIYAFSHPSTSAS